MVLLQPNRSPNFKVRTMSSHLLVCLQRCKRQDLSYETEVLYGIFQILNGGVFLKDVTAKFPVSSSTKEKILSQVNNLNVVNTSRLPPLTTRGRHTTLALWSLTK